MIIFVQFVRPDLITGEFIHVTGWAALPRTDVGHQHHVATMHAQRYGEQYYRIMQGRSLAQATPISLVHDVRGK